MDLTILIPCRDDARLVKCVRSVDADAEVLVVLNGSPTGFREHIERDVGDRVRILEVDRPNATLAIERGIPAAASDRVLLMDSDCTFAPGSLAAFEAAFDLGSPTDEVYKGRIRFDRTGPSSALVARSREQRQGAVAAYKPPLAFDRRLGERLDGWFFDPRLRWKEDAAFSHRLTQIGVRVVPVDGCVIHHAPLPIRGDLRSTFHYGIGSAIARHLDVPMVPPNRSVRAARQRGLDQAAYLLLGNAVLSTGRWYAEARLRFSRGRWIERVSGP